MFEALNEGEGGDAGQILSKCHKVCRFAFFAGGVVTAVLADHEWSILFSVFFGAHLAEGMSEEMGALIADKLCWPVGLAFWFSSSYLLYQLV